jgi:uncharacterized cupin superfamily protein
VPDYTAKRIDEMEAFYLGALRKVRAELGLTSFGVQTVDVPPGFERTPWHDHAEDGQEELYIALREHGRLEIEGGQTIELAPREMAVRVGPDARRRVIAGPQGIRVLVVGGVPVRPFSAKEFTDLGAADPWAAGA